MKYIESNKDFPLFCFFAKGIVAWGAAIKSNEKKQVSNEMAFRFNPLVNSATLFEKQLHRLIGDEFASAEDDINTLLCGLVLQIYNMPDDMKDRFFNHMEGFNLVEAQYQESHAD